ncbi:hypothetical protein LTR37_020219 [Vermiconidia calcicola]|uniref:Uncharacterized protein n=1 Tax=Vermiconidia calcicola TaxID=1690605 RepID=A0ACC3MD41_9PEZI|nr:hypothetical protein LTR37_020219 [Vermiconidia calcicola]
MSRVQEEGLVTITDGKDSEGKGSTAPTAVETFSNVSLPRTPAGSRWDVSVANGQISGILTHNPDIRGSAGGTQVDGCGALLAPSLCHPHVHIDKAYLLSHPKYAHLQVEKGDFEEAMTLTGTAKKDFEEWDLLERGQRVIDESVAAGVTHMRAFVEVDAVVGTKCLDAGIQLKKQAEKGGKCIVQLCAYAQLPLFTSSPGDQSGLVIRGLLLEAARRPEVDVVGSTPYVEADRKKAKENIEWMVDLSIRTGTHLDFHLDYHLDRDNKPTVWHVIGTLKEEEFSRRAKNSTVVLGHCTRLTLLDPKEWRRLKKEIGGLPISFVGLPTSDMFMMRTPNRTRGTLDVPAMIKGHGLNACIGINNIGNAFTPYGSCDPLTLACNGVGLYQAGTAQDAELLYECVSSRARKAIGLGGAGASMLELNVGNDASVVLFGSEPHAWRTRRSVPEVVYLYDHCRNRTAYLRGICTTSID